MKKYADWYFANFKRFKVAQSTPNYHKHKLFFINYSLSRKQVLEMTKKDKKQS